MSVASGVELGGAWMAASGQPTQVIGSIQTAIGCATITGASGGAALAVDGDPVCQGDAIETGADGRVEIHLIDGTVLTLSRDTRVVLGEFTQGSEGSLRSALFAITRGMVDTPIGSIRSRTEGGGIALLSLAALTFALMKEAQAADPNVTFLDDDSITYKDLAHGVFELVTKEAVPRHIIVEDPGETVVLTRKGSSVSLSEVANSPARMEELHAAQQEALANFAKGPAQGGSSAPPFSDPDFMPQPINFVPGGSPTLEGAPLPIVATLTPTPISVILLPQAPPVPVLPTLAITSIAGQIGIAADNIINAAKANAGVVITGATSGVQDGRTVTVTIVNSSDQVVYSGTATVTNNTWTIDIAPAEAKGLADGIYTLTADTSNAAGNAAEATRTIMVDETPPTIAIHTVAGDNIVNVKTASTGFAISGTTVGAENGQPVTVKVVDASGHIIDTFATTLTNNSWSVNVSSSDAKLLRDGSYTVTADVSDSAGNVAQEATQTIRVDETPPTIAIHTVAEDNLINIKTACTGFTIAGTANGAENGQPVTVKIVDGSGHVVDTLTTTLANNSWSVNVSSSEAKLLHDGSYTVTADISDSAGNPAQEATQVITVDETPPAVTWLPQTERGAEGMAIRLGAIAVSVPNLPGHDDSVESLVISDIPPGAVLTDGTNCFMATNGNNSVDVNSWNLLCLKIIPSNDTNFSLAVTATDQDGNAASASELITVAPLVPCLNPVEAHGKEDTAIALDLGVTAKSLPGPHGDLIPNTLDTLVVGCIPVGATLRDCDGHCFTATPDQTSLDVASWNLSSLTITPPAEFDGRIKLTIAATEHDSEGDVSATVTATELVIVDPVARPPTASAPATLMLHENATCVAIGGVSVGPLAEDRDDTVSATLSVSHGTLDVADMSGVTVSGDDCATLTLSGNAAAVNLLLAGLTYTPTARYEGRDTLHLSVTSSDGSDTYPTAAMAATAIKITEDSEALIVGQPGPTLNWSDSHNWSGGYVPTSSTHTTIDAPSCYTVIIAGAQDAASLTIPHGAASADITAGGTLQLAGDLDVSYSGKLENDGALREAANAHFVGPITNNGAIVIDPDVHLDVTGPIAGSGKFSIDSGATLEFDSGSKLAPGTTDSQAIYFEQGTGKLIIDDCGKFAGVIAGDEGAHLTSADLIDLTRLPYVEGSMSACASYNSCTNISTIIFGDGVSSNNVTLHFSGDYTDSTWSFAGVNGGPGTEVADPPMNSGVASSVPIGAAPVVDAAVQPSALMQSIGAHDTEPSSIAQAVFGEAVDTHAASFHFKDEMSGSKGPSVIGAAEPNDLLAWIGRHEDAAGTHGSPVTLAETQATESMPGQHLDDHLNLISHHALGALVTHMPFELAV